MARLRLLAPLAMIPLFFMGIAAGVFAVEPGPSPAAISFERDVRPTLAGKCFKCHGAPRSEAGLRFTDRDGALAPLESGNIAVVPGKPEESELIRRVLSDDPDERMPPGKEPLSPVEIGLLKTWIAAGADWPRHWAYRPLASPEVPEPRDADLKNWARTPIDRFIARTLEARSMTPSPPADRRSLLRRVHVDLVGLPPAPEELAAFLADDSPDAYERVVDRLLASPRYGERWARHWMDVVHFAETHGHDQDRPRDHAWPYRDYLIRAFNQDLPYDRFLREQIAGDVLFPDDPWAIRAVGFLAAGPWDESSLRDIREDTLDREIARYLDRDDIVATVMSTFASTTVHCARCHGHKFDPISQEEYYALQAVFAGIDKANREYDPDPAAAARRREWSGRLEQIDRLRKEKDAILSSPERAAEVAAWEESFAARGASRWRPLTVVECVSQGGATIKNLDDGSLLVAGPRPDKDVYAIVAKTSLHSVAAMRIDVLPDENLPSRGPGRQDNGNFHLSEARVFVVPSDSAAAWRPVGWKNPRADFEQPGWSIAEAIDGDPNTAWGIHPEAGKPHRAALEFAEPAVRAADEPNEITLRIELHQLHGTGHLIGRFRLSVAESGGALSLDAELPPPAVAAALAVPAAARNEEQRLDLAAYVWKQKLQADLASLPPRQLVYCGANRFQPEGTFRPAVTPRRVFVLERGAITQPRQEVQPGALSCVDTLERSFSLADPADEGARRVALAAWLADPRNMLVWRSIVNRLWQQHFGRGLVDSPNDFGHMGSPPSHPELLDYLATELLRGGGSLKAIHRLMVTSAVYRQSSAHREEYAAGDGDNVWLWRMNRRRLDAESIRDAVLAVSGKLDSTMGGPSARQFISTPGVHVTPNVDYLGFDPDHPANFRRGVYRFIFRTIPDPFMDALDCPDGAQLAPKRNESITALQALATLNDKFIVRQSEHLAARLEKEYPDLGGRIDAAFLAVLLRPPAPRQRELVAAYAAQHGLANACRFLLNSNEFLFVD